MILNFGSGYEYSDQFALDMLRKPPADPYWDGIEAHYLWLNGTTYVRCRLGDKPDAHNVAFAPFGSAVVRVDHQSHVIIRGFRLRNAHWCIALTGANDCIVENNYVSTFGKAGIVVEKGAARNHIRNNECTQDYIYPGFGHPWNSPVDRHMWMVWKDYCYGDRMGIRLQDDYGPDNQVYGNHVFRTFDGICTKDGAPGVYVFNNIVENIADDALNSSGTANNAEWHDNLVIEGGNGCITIDGNPQFQVRCMFIGIASITRKPRIRAAASTSRTPSRRQRTSTRTTTASPATGRASAPTTGPPA